MRGTLRARLPFCLSVSLSFCRAASTDPKPNTDPFFEAGLGLNRRDTETRSIIPKCRSYDDV